MNPFRVSRWTAREVRVGSTGELRGEETRVLVNAGSREGEIHGKKKKKTGEEDGMEVRKKESEREE
jgi:hypothetical protein